MGRRGERDEHGDEHRQRAPSGVDDRKDAERQQREIDRRIAVTIERSTPENASSESHETKTAPPTMMHAEKTSKTSPRRVAPRYSWPTPGTSNDRSPATSIDPVYVRCSDATGGDARGR